MCRIGIWDRNERLYEAVLADIAQKGAPRPLLLHGHHPAELAGGMLDLLVVSPAATAWAGAGSVSCRIVLLPGSAGPMVRGMHVESAVSYGSGPKDTITLSSLKGETICLAIQRELVTVYGGVIERQELVFPFPAGQCSPDLFMARVGASLLLGLDTDYSNR